MSGEEEPILELTTKGAQSPDLQAVTSTTVDPHQYPTSAPKKTNWTEVEKEADKWEPPEPEDPEVVKRREENERKNDKKELERIRKAKEAGTHVPSWKPLADVKKIASEHMKDAEESLKGRKYKDAVAHARKAIDAFGVEAEYEAQPDRLKAIAFAGRAATEGKDWETGIGYLADVFRIKKLSAGPVSQDTAQAEADLGTAHLRASRWTGAIEHLSNALAVYKMTIGLDSALAKTARKNLEFAQKLDRGEVDAWTRRMHGLKLSPAQEAAEAKRKAEREAKRREALSTAAKDKVSAQVKSEDKVKEEASEAKKLAAQEDVQPKKAVKQEEPPLKTVDPENAPTSSLKEEKGATKKEGQDGEVKDGVKAGAQEEVKKVKAAAAAAKLIVPEDESCVFCGGKPVSRCGRCKEVWYCGAVCQKGHWKAGHKSTCTPVQ